MVEIRHKSFGAVGTTQQPEKKETISLNDLQSLIELGCVRDTIALGTLKFELRSLNATERVNLAKFLGETPTENILFQFNIKLLALSIESVDGKSLESFHPEYNKQGSDIVVMREEIISSMQAPVIAKLLNFYNEIANRSDAQFDSEQIKN